MSSRKIRFALLSDLHAFDSTQFNDKVGNKPTVPSYLDISKEHHRNPIQSLLQLIKNESLSADYLLCAGDITDKAVPTAFKKAWEYVINISESLGAELLATCGNHDLDTHGKFNDYDPKGYIQSISPKFPNKDETINNKFWAKNYHILSTDKINIVVLNSAAYHGYGNEKEHGRISEYTLNSITDELNNLSNLHSTINILLCHHHPFKFPNIEKDKYSEMKGGLELLEIFGSNRFGEWLIVHGHIHYPKILNAAGSSTSATIFSLASFSAVPYPIEEYGLTRNQFYIIEIDPHDIETYGLRGIGQAWDYSKSYGWVPAKEMMNMGLTHNFGFGNTEKPRTIASQILERLENGELWDSIESVFSNIYYLLPEEHSSLIDSLKEKGLEVIANNGKIVEVIHGGK